MKKTLCIIFVLLAYPIYVMFSIYFYSFKSSHETADAAIVLGAAVWHGQPSPVFEQRIKHAIKLYHAKQVSTLIFTGGIGEGDRQSEAAVGRAYAIRHGVPAEAILIEEQSKVTFENLRYAAALMTKNQIQSVLLVSDPLHMKRAMLIAHQVGIHAEPSPTTTSRYQSLRAKGNMLLSETYYYLGLQLRFITQ
ncbi:hypothetical protein VST7929_02782 [Vibrio stylophorae]|uniref:DUF218 domain-containing protein n=1 Tax=Vibrio stylophorae TaxID=659351 RepID=A0ABM8ZWV4_9VIBR|nr:YdcF family protein [Vibrio stylophorae]CAH0535121.1 hypothetical protein VST7929_02782 [Vibrio stylophorae]